MGTKKERQMKKGFTLVELICVVALIAILTMAALPSFSDVREEAARQVAVSNAKTVYSQAAAYEALGETEEENMDLVEGGFVVWDGDELKEAGWEGELNGKRYRAVYDGEEGRIEEP